MKTPLFSSLFATILLIGSLSVSSAFAQGVFEGSGEVADPNCVGDGCGYIDPNQEQATEPEQGTEPNTEQEQGTEPSAEQVSATEDTSASDSTQSDSTDSPEDSVAAEPAKSVVNIDEEDEDRPSYINENADEYRARKEGFSRGIQFGFRIGGGVNTSFGDGSENWNLGYEFTGGILAQLPLGSSFGVATELDFSYRHYSYEEDIEYGHNEATIDEFLFEIPVIAQYIFDEDGLFIGLGVNLGLKMSGDSEFKQEIETEQYSDSDKHSNTLPTVGVEIGGLFDIGYKVTHWLVADLRVIQNFTNTLDLDYAAESSLMHTKLYTMHITAGLTFLL